MGFPGGSAGKESACNGGGGGGGVWSRGWEEPLEKGKATHSSVLAWENSMDCIVRGVAESNMTEKISLSHSRHFYYIFVTNRCQEKNTVGFCNSE